MRLWTLRRLLPKPLPERRSRGGPDHLVGRPLSEVERYYMQKALDLTDGNREEAAKRLGIGERTLYRVMQDWKLQDKIKQALIEAGWDMGAAAAKLGLKATTLERKVKKWGWPPH